MLPYLMVNIPYSFFMIYYSLHIGGYGVIQKTGSALAKRSVRSLRVYREVA